MKINYNKVMENEIEKIKMSNTKPRLLLHACCAPCSSAVLEVLNGFFDITIFFHNPNISPKEEFDFRLKELERLLTEMNLDSIRIYSPEYDPTEFTNIAEGYETLPEGGKRCERCYSLRLEKAFEYARENNFDYVTTTLSVSPYKNAELLNKIGVDLEGKFKVRYLQSDFKKNEGYKRSCELSKQYNLYRQNYCGCIYSKIAAENKRA